MSTVNTAMANALYRAAFGVAKQMNPRRDTLDSAIKIAEKIESNKIGVRLARDKATPEVVARQLSRNHANYWR